MAHGTVCSLSQQEVIGEGTHRQLDGGLGCRGAPEPVAAAVAVVCRVAEAEGEDAVCCEALIEESPDDHTAACQMFARHNGNFSFPKHP